MSRSVPTTLVRWAFLHRRALLVLLALCISAGVLAINRSAQSLYPNLAFPRIAVIAERGEVPVRSMLVGVTKTIERAVSLVPHLNRLRSKTVRGASELSLGFDASADMTRVLSLVRARIAEADLPPDTHIIIEQQTPAVFPVMSFNVLAGDAVADDPVARARLADWVRLELEPRINRLPDASRVTVQSGDQREYVVELDPQALARAGVAVEDVRDTIAAADTVAAVGRLASEGLQYQLVVDGQLHQASQILDLAVASRDGEPVLLRELGELIETVAERTRIVTGGGRDGVVLSVFLRDGGRVVDLSDDVERILDEVRPQLPGHAQIVPVYDQSDLVETSIDGVKDAIAIGALLSILVIAIFLGDLRMTLVTGVAIPMSVLLTIALFPVFDESLNLMSLGGIAVAIGLIIDDAIVVVENVSRRIAQSASTTPAEVLDSVSNGTREVTGAIIGSSLTTVVVFLPLVLLEGVVGQFFRSLSLALGISIVMSMIVSLVYSPLLLLASALRFPHYPRIRHWMVSLQNAYRRATEIVVDRPALTTMALIVVLAIGLVGSVGIGTGFLPEMDEGGFVLDYTLPVGSSLQETDAACRSIETILRETPEIASLSRRTGAELGFFATEQFTGDMLVALRPPAQRGRSVFEVIDVLRERIARETPQAEVEFVQVMQDTIADLAGNPAPIEIKLFGDDYAVLQQFADRVASRIETLPGIVDVRNHVSFGSPELRWRPDAYRAAQVGLTTAQIAAETSAQLLGDVATRIREGDQLIDVRVRSSDSARASASIAGDDPPVFISLDDRAATVPLSSVASFRRVLNENELERENQTPMVRVTASVAGRDLGSTSKVLERAVLDLDRNPAIRIEFGGQVASQKSAFASLLAVFGLGVGLVFLLLGAQFRSFSLPIVIFLALPFGQIGGLCALRLMDVNLDISSGMGLILLVGLAVKNGIILIEYAQELRRDGKSERQAVLEAARVRLRPILMTTFAAIAGLVPLAIGIGAGSELQRPLAIAVVGGLLVSTTFSLIVIPLGCLTLARGRLIGRELDEVTTTEGPSCPAA